MLRQPYSFVLRRMGARPRTVARFDSSRMNFSGDRSFPWRAVREVRWMLDRPIRGYEHLDPFEVLAFFVREDESPPPRRRDWPLRRFGTPFVLMGPLVTPSLGDIADFVADASGLVVADRP